MTTKRIVDLLSYDAETGFIYWKVSNGRRAVAGSKAGSKHNAGYTRIGIDGVDYLAHRIAWLLYTGDWPKFQIDHINGDRNDNRIVNLRDVTPAENTQNQKKSQRGSKSGTLGVFKVWNKYRADISFNGQHKYLGMFSSPTDAHRAYLEAKRSFHKTCTI
jgi:hypothetical protein